MIRYIISSLLILLLANSCITQFLPESEDFRNIVVIEGLITNEDKSHYIKLSRTRPIEVSGTSSPVTGAFVQIHDDEGNIHTLIEERPGIFHTDSLTFRGVVDRSYKLRVHINGKTIESDLVKMTSVPPIGDLYPKFEYLDDGYIYPPLFSYEVFFDTEDPTNTCRYYRWTYEEVWEYHLPWNYPPESKRICWITEHSSEIMIKNTSAQEWGRVKEFPLVSLDNRSTEKLSHKYSILLRQYSVSEKEYSYWENMKKLSDGVGTLYDPIPMAIEGNLYSRDDPSETILGYFSVSAVASQRLFIKNDTIKMSRPGQYCVTDTLKTITGVTGIGRTIFVLEELDGVGFLVSLYPQCADCTYRGSNITPLFWNDDILK